MVVFRLLWFGLPLLVAATFSPRLRWSFGIREPSDAATAILTTEGLLSAPLWADAFDTIEQLEEWAVRRQVEASTMSELSSSWVRARSALVGWLSCAKKPCRAPALPCATLIALQKDDCPALGSSTSRAQEDVQLVKYLDRMVQFAWRMHQCSHLMLELKRDVSKHGDIDRLLRIALKGFSASTWASVCRAVERFENWLVGLGHSGRQIPGTVVAQHLMDLFEVGATVPTAALSSIATVSRLLILSWPVEHPLVIGVAKEARRVGANRISGKHQVPLPCLSIQQLKHLEQVTCDTAVPLALRWAAAFACLLTHVCLRFSDAQRSKGIQTNGVSIFGYTWCSKSKRTGVSMGSSVPRLVRLSLGGLLV